MTAKTEKSQDQNHIELLQRAADTLYQMDNHAVIVDGIIPALKALCLAHKVPNEILFLVNSLEKSAFYLSEQGAEYLSAEICRAID